MVKFKYKFSFYTISRLNPHRKTQLNMLLIKAPSIYPEVLIWNGNHSLVKVILPELFARIQYPFPGSMFSVMV